MSTEQNSHYDWNDPAYDKEADWSEFDKELALLEEVEKEEKEQK